MLGGREGEGERGVIGGLPILQGPLLVLLQEACAI